MEIKKKGSWDSIGCNASFKKMPTLLSQQSRVTSRDGLKILAIDEKGVGQLWKQGTLYFKRCLLYLYRYALYPRYKYVKFLFSYTICRALGNLILFATSLFPACISAGTSGGSCHPSTVAFR
jgi:hypothetical protein